VKDSSREGEVDWTGPENIFDRTQNLKLDSDGSGSVFNRKETLKKNRFIFGITK